MDKAKAAVSDFLHSNNKHSVDIEQETAPAVTHERVQKSQHENLTTAVDRETHQHHHQTHVQPLSDRVVEPETHHHNVLPVEHRKHHHGKDAEVARTLESQAAQFKDEREHLPTQHSQSANTLVGEHVHHHIHDKIQPVVEREVLQPHVVHTTVPIHEHIEKAPVIHEGNVLPTKTLAEFTSAGGNALTSGTHTREHIDYEGDPLKINDKSHVGFSHASRHPGDGTTGRPGELGTTTGVAGAAGLVGEHGHHHHHHKDTAGPHSSDAANKLDPRVDSDRDGSRTVGNTGTTGYGTTSTSTTGTTGYGTTGTTGYGTTGTSTTGTTTSGGAGPHTSSTANKLDPRVDSDGSKGLGAGHTTGSGTTGTSGTGYGTSGTSSGLGENITGREADYTTGTTGTAGSGLHSTPRTAGDVGYGNTSGTGLGSGNTGVSERAATTDTTASKESTTDKLLHKVGLK